MCSLCSIHFVQSFTIKLFHNFTHSHILTSHFVFFSAMYPNAPMLVHFKFTMSKQALGALFPSCMRVDSSRFNLKKYLNRMTLLPNPFVIVHGRRLAVRRGQKLVLNQLTSGTSGSMTKPAEPSMREQCLYICKPEAATDGTQSLRLTCRMRQMLSLPKTSNIPTVEQNRAHYFLLDSAQCKPRYFTPRPKTGLQARECGTLKINPASDLLGVLADCEEHRV